MHLNNRIPELEEHAWDLTQQIRNSRAKLGSVLEWLETNDPDPQTIASLYECAEDVRAEIDRLVVAIAILPRPGDIPCEG
jgi:hypothetical protein